MSTERIIRAWKDESFRASLSDAERGLVPDHPAGLIELDDAQLTIAAGAMRPVTKANTCTIDTWVCCCNSVVSCAGCF